MSKWEEHALAGSGLSLDVHRSHAEVTVWLDTTVEHMDGLVVGVGDTEAEAWHDATLTLREALALAEDQLRWGGQSAGGAKVEAMRHTRAMRLARAVAPLPVERAAERRSEHPRRQPAEVEARNGDGR